MDGMHETMTALKYAAACVNPVEAAVPVATYSQLAACAQCAAFGIPYQGAAAARPVAALAPIAIAPTAVAPLVPATVPIAQPLRAGIPVFGAVGALPRLAYPTFAIDGL